MPSGELAGRLGELAREEDVREVVVGVPRTLGGDVGFQARRVLDTLDALKSGLPGVRFVEWDERFTTRLAKVPAKAGGRRKRRGGKREGAKRESGGRKESGAVDHRAAAWMLQEYLDTRGTL